MNEKIYFVGNSNLIKSDLYTHSDINKVVKWLDSIDYVCLDTETEGMFNHKNKMVMLQLAHKNTIFVIDTRVVSIKSLPLENKLIIGQNLKFDYKFLKLEGIELTKIYDTFLAECCLTNGLKERSLSLDSLAQKYCSLTLDKSVRNQFINLNGQPFTESQIVYGVKDVTCLEEIKTKQETLLKEWQIDAWANNEFDACLALADIEYNGIKLDKDKWLEIARINEADIPVLIEELDQLVLSDKRLKKFVKTHIQGSLFEEVKDRKVLTEWSSPLQVKPVFEALGITIESTSEKDISKYQEDYPLIKKFIDYKKKSKLVTTYGKTFLDYINPYTGRIHTSIWQIKDTSRVSSGDKHSPNLQNIPATKEFLSCFISEKGNKLIACDYSGQEARVAAYASKDEVWLKTFQDGKDLHSEVCKMMFNIDEELVKTKPDFLRGKSYRDVAKTINFMALFGGSEYKLSKVLNNSIEESKELLNKYFAATKELQGFLKKCADYALKNGYIKSFKPYSIIRFFPDWHEDLDEFRDRKIIGEITRAAYNTPIQASASQMTKRALVLVRDFIKQNKLSDKIRIVHVVHDCIITECNEDLAEEFGSVQRKLMTQAGKEFTTVLEFSTDIEIENYWKK